MADARAGYEPILNEALGLYPSLLNDPPPVRVGNQKVKHLAHGWYLRCHRSVEAILTLDRAGFAEEASPIRRSVIEHTVALNWLAVEGDKIEDTVANGHARHTETLSKAISAAAWTSVDLAELTEIIAEIDPENRNQRNNHLLHWDKRLEGYGDEHTLPGYLAECAKTHPSYQSAISYIEIPDGAIEIPDGALLWEPQDPLWQVPFCTTHLLMALVSVRQIFDPEPWERELEDIGERYRVVTDAVRHQDGLAPINWATGTLQS